MAQQDKNRMPVFRPDAFEANSLEHAKALTVTAELGTTTDERWQKETSYLVQDIGKFFSLSQESCVLDYGCGTGRISKELIETHGCRAIGIDTSRSMRLLAPEYVLSERFTVWSVETLGKMIDKGFRAEYCVCLWVIQHVLDPAEVINRISRVLKPGGILYSLNQFTRSVPTDIGWVNDGFNVFSALRRAFSEENFHALPESATTPQLAGGTMIQVLRKTTT